MLVSLFPNVRDTTTVKDADVMTVLKNFKNVDSHNIEDLRSKTTEEQSKLKMQLPVVIFGGTFKERRSSALKKASGLMVLDFDCDSESESKRVEEICKNDEYIWAYFRSTRGLGWKALVQIPEVKSDAEYKEYWNAVNAHFPDIDAACKDIARSCFYSYDPKLVIKEKFKKFTHKLSEQKTKTVTKKLSRKTNYDLLNKALNLIRNAEKGERHNTILKAARLCGGWVASGKVDYQEAERLLIQEAYKFNPGDAANEKTITDGLDHGMREPLDDEEIFTQEKLEQKFEKLYYTLADVEDELIKKREEGLPEGYTTGHREFDNHYRMHLGYTTYIYGAPFSGKSLVWFHILKRYAIKYNMKHVIFSPETGSAADIMITLMELYIGRKFYRDRGQSMSEEQYKEARDFVDQHFIVIDPKEKTMTIDELISSCEIIERVYNVKIHTVTIDPFNDLHTDFGNDPRDIWLEKQLRKARVVAMVNNWHVCIITHTQDQKPMRTTHGAFYDIPTFREVAGGQAWSRRGFMMMAVFRPHEKQDEVQGIEVKKNSTLIQIQKYKPKWAGELGTVHWTYNLNSLSYEEGGVDPDDQSDKIAPMNYDDIEVPF